ncbi:MAG: secondary thiamine-phosphate synthase enzyme YjbQ [Candidatus Bipolaricaulota bacterium]|nr:secondary thiamine-phosphate synthase enzyme YjbQ [Candidatus Bipolaricaulota bacterium]
MQTIRVTTHRKTEFVEITPAVEAVVSRLGVAEGLCTLYCPHTTAGLMINERADPAVVHDIGSFLEEFVPERRAWTHAEGNSPAHVKAALIGESVQILIEGGKLRLGTWQGIFCAEFDGPRERKIWLRIAS